MSVIQRETLIHSGRANKSANYIFLGRGNILLLLMELNPISCCIAMRQQRASELLKCESPPRRKAILSLLSFPFTPVRCVSETTHEIPRA